MLDYHKGMNRIDFKKQFPLKPVVRGLYFIVLGFTLNLAIWAGMGVSQAQDKSRSEEAVQAKPVQPIQRSTTAYNNGGNKRSAAPIQRVDWTTLPSTYTHSPDGQRVDQFASVTPEPVFELPSYAKSGYRHTRSTLQAGFSSDNYHLVEQWGAPIRPYGEWRYPNRPFAVPYGAWGPQLPQVVGAGVGIFPGAFPVGPQPFPQMNGNAVLPGGQIPPGNPWMQPPYGVPFFGVGPQNVLTPTQDDYYRQAPMLQGPNYHPLRNGLE
jgi:hypothetical protein